MEFTGTVTGIKFRNEENGWTVLRIKGDDGEELTAVGVMPSVNDGEHVTVTGNMTAHPMYGEQIRVTSYKNDIPTSAEAVRAYLASGFIKGIGEATARLLVDKFGAETLEIIKTEPMKLTRISGIGPKKAKMIHESYIEKAAMQDIIMGMQLQTDHILEQDGKIEKLNGQIDEFWSRYSAQTMFLYACLVILILFAALLGIIVRAYWMKNRMNAELSSQKKKLEEQRDQLISLSKQLEEATHAKLVFFTNVSHDFRTPLTLVAAPVEQLLEDEALTSRQRSLLQMVHKNVTILLRLVNQILDFRKYENGKLELVLSNIDLRAQLQEWSGAFRALALKKHIHFILDVENGQADYKMALDAEKMERIYFNVLSNAFKFTPENGSIVVTLSAIAQADGKEYARLVVSDSGSGISVQHIRHIFDRFYQIDVNHAGSGIGLALTKAFVELHGGTIAVDSMEGKGTVFTIDIPVNRWSATEIERKESEGIGIPSRSVVEELSEAETEEVKPDESKACVLVIDDNADVRS